jgi:hypothetical protein
VKLSSIPLDPAAAKEAMLAAARLELAAKMARKDFTDFVKMCVVDETGRPFALEPMHLAWHRHVTWCWRKGLHAGILAPWGHGKSAGLVVPLPAWLLGVNQNLRVKIVCSSTELARERVSSIKTLVTSPAYHEVFPVVRQGGAWKADEVTLERTGNASDPSLQAKGVFGIGVGKRADILIFDDVVDQRNSAEQLQRRKVREFVSQTWMGRLTPQGRALYIATPWNTDDATHHIMQRPGWCFLKHAVSEDANYVEQTVLGADHTYPGWPQ